MRDGHAQGTPQRLDRYTGVAALDAAGPIVSRHIAHPDNKRVEAQLLADLRAMGYCPWRHDFLHNGVTHSNVIADLPGNGRFRIKPALLERIRRILAGEDGDVRGTAARRTAARLGRRRRAARSGAPTSCPSRRCGASSSGSSPSSRGTRGGS